MTRKRMLSGLALGVCLGILTAGTAMGSDAGWVDEGMGPRYVDSRGNYVTNDWKQKDGEYYYLGSDGQLERGTWIENEYYVDKSGAMVKNNWVHDDGSSGLKDAGWYYLGKDGKSEAGGWKNIGGARYCFDKDGKMRSGWYYEGDNIYYLGGEDDGIMRKGWQCLEFDRENPPDEGDVSKEYSTAGDNARWFYFQNNGKAKRSSVKTYTPTTINGKKYYFDTNGALMTGWHAVASSSQAGDSVGISRFVYLGSQDDGDVIRNEWKLLSEHPGDSEDGQVVAGKGTDQGPKKGDKEWYYFESDGTPAHLRTRVTTMNGATTKINGDNYFFDQFGRRRTGLIKVTSGGTQMVAYFGEKDSNGRMRTGRITGIQDGTGERHTYYFSVSGANKGIGFTGEKNGFLYNSGLLVTAEKGLENQVYKVDGKIYLVNSKGKIQVNDKLYRSGTRRYRIEDGVIYESDIGGAKKQRVTDGAAPPAVVCGEEFSV